MTHQMNAWSEDEAKWMKKELVHRGYINVQIIFHEINWMRIVQYDDPKPFIK